MGNLIRLREYASTLRHGSLECEAFAMANSMGAATPNPKLGRWTRQAVAPPPQ